ncbi:MAG: hypothetical protein A2Y81_13150 [Nitrospirae bacterium RBG_13_43_8]|nr:MAG: hypothetical protein A2Y81_13150 [Nitrospirae bacterium RBG_13_43_8]
MRWLKGISSRIVLLEGPHLKKRFWGKHLWARDYLAVSLGKTNFFWGSYDNSDQRHRTGFDLAVEFKILFTVIVMSMAFLAIFSGEAQSKWINVMGPLKVHPKNPRYFSDQSGKTVYLTGSHVWDNFQDWGGSITAFDYDAYLEFLKANNHNFIRLWKIGENTIKGGNLITPMPWERTGPGLAKDGKLRFDLSRLNEAYFSRLRSRVIEAGKQGIYISVMLFDGIYEWTTHPFHPANNVNGIDGGGAAFFTVGTPEVNRRQKEYVFKVIDTVNDLDNVLYEVGNEIKGSTKWQYHIINHIREYEKTKPKQHPVGMTSTGGDGADDLINYDLFNSPADWISPRSSEPGQNYSYNPPPATGKKVIISDTDHLWGVLSDPTPEWVWKSFLRGLNPILMDVLQNRGPAPTERWSDPNRPGLALTRLAMGQTLKYANRVDLLRMVPRIELASTKYCLANAGVEYLVYLPFGDIRKRERILQNIGIIGRKISVDLFGVSGTFRIEWFNPRADQVIDGGTITGGATRFFKIPFSGDAVLYLYRG